VLVADDEIPLCDLMEAIIRKRVGCQVSVAHDGGGVLDYLASEVTDVLVADMVMPGIQGLELVAAVQKNWPYTDIIAVTGYAEDFPYVKVIRAGAKDFLAKPFQAGELEAKLLRVFRERDLRDAQIMAESKYRSLFELNTDGMVFLDDKTRTVLDANAAFCRLCGQDLEAIVQKPLADLLDPFERGRFEQGLSLCSRNDQGTLGDVVLVRPDGQETFADVSVTFITVGADRVACLGFKDTTEKRELEDHLVEAAQMDDLTGLLNRRTFSRNLAGAINQAMAGHKPLSLMLLDLDNFKRCNDTYGHPVGDQLLRTLGRVIKDNIRRELDQGFRYGGDEFAVLLSNADARAASRIGERMLADMTNKENFGTSLSIGIAEYHHGMPGKELTRLADEALYRAKALGKNTVCVA
jgi:diguanylate cyclase (GGDEF)-like protein/PAS domain S-box-containing protein